MADRLPRVKVDEMWLEFQRHGSAAEVARVCHAHPRTVARLRRAENWDQRLAEVRAKSQQEADYDLAAARAQSLRLLRMYKDRVEVALREKKVAPDEVTAGELDRIIRAEQLLLGEPDARTEVVTEIGSRFAAMSDDQLERFARDGILPG